MVKRLAMALITTVLVAVMFSGAATGRENGLQAECKQGGGKDLVTTEDASFRNQGQCVRCAASGRTPIPELLLGSFNFLFWALS